MKSLKKISLLLGLLIAGATSFFGLANASTESQAITDTEKSSNASSVTNDVEVASSVMNDEEMSAVVAGSKSGSGGGVEPGHSDNKKPAPRSRH